MFERLTIKRRLTNHFSSTLVSNSYIILAMRLIGPGGSFLFWVLAARFLNPQGVGLASGVIAAAALLAGLSQLGIGYVLVRYLPGNRQPGRLINLALGAVTSVSLLLTLLFIAGLDYWSPALALLREDPILLLAFCLFVLSFGISQMLNSAFLARRKPIYSLYKNAIQTTLSIIFLLLLFFFLGNYMAAVFAYSLSMIIAVTVSIWAFLPRTDPTFHLAPRLPRTLRSPFSKFALSNYVSDQFLRAPNNLVTLMVINLLGVTIGAYFFVAWNVAGGLLALSGSVSRSLLAEGSNTPGRLPALTRSSLKLGLFFSSGMVLAAAILSKLILSIYGSDYFQISQDLFLLLLLSIIPAALVLIYLNVLRVQKKLKLLILITAINMVISLLLTYLFTNLYGLTGAGIGWLAAKLVIFAYVAVIWIRQRD